MTSNLFSGAVAREKSKHFTPTICSLSTRHQSSINSFLAPLRGVSQSSARGVSRFQSLYFVFVLLGLFYFISFAFNYKKHKKLVTCI
jgi:hypothetical protein